MGSTQSFCRFEGIFLHADAGKSRKSAERDAFSRFGEMQRRAIQQHPPCTFPEKIRDEHDASIEEKSKLRYKLTDRKTIDVKQKQKTVRTVPTRSIFRLKRLAARSGSGAKAMEFFADGEPRSHNTDLA